MAQKNRFQMLKPGNRVKEIVQDKETAQVNANQLSRELAADKPKVPVSPDNAGTGPEMPAASPEKKGEKETVKLKARGAAGKGRGVQGRGPQVKSVNVTARLHYLLQFRMMQTGAKNADEFLWDALMQYEKKLVKEYGEVVFPPGME